jgi:hypothetical protein
MENHMADWIPIIGCAVTAGLSASARKEGRKIRAILLGALSFVFLCLCLYALYGALSRIDS